MRYLGRMGIASMVGLLVGCAGEGWERSPIHGDQAAGGPAIMDWRASTFEISRQDQAALDVGTDGSIYAVWASDRPRWGVFGQRFSADGRAIGSETALSLWAPGMQCAPSVAAIPGGGAWVAWQSWRQDGDEGAIIARRFGQDFVGSSEVLINQDPAGDQRSPVVAVAPDRTAAFVWASTSGEGPAGLRVRLFGADGTPLTDEMGIGGDGSVRSASIASAPDGTFAIAYAAFDAGENPAGILVQRIDSAGRRLGEPVTVSGLPGVEPSITTTGDGFVAAWIDGTSDGDDYGIVARRLDATGAPLGEPFVVNTTTTGSQTGATVTARAGGGFAVAWNSGGGIRLRTFDSAARPEGGEVVLQDEGERTMRVAAGTRRLAEDGRRLVCVWSGRTPEAEEEEIEHAGGVDPDAGGAVGISMVAYDGFDGRGVRQGVREGMRAAGPAGQGQHEGLAEPHRPPTFNPREIETGRRQIIAQGEGGFDAVLNTGWTPPDPHMAVGPAHIICVTNGAIRFFLKNGQQTFADEIEGAQGFWGGLGATGFVFDPEVVYDGLSGRFFAMAAEGYAPPNQTKSYCLIAVSDDSDPNGTWYKYRFDTTGLAGNLFDSPNIGVTDDAVVITGDGFPNGPANYPVYIYDKVSILAGNPPLVKKVLTMQTTTQSAGFPPVSYDSPPAVYFIEHKESNSNTSVRLVALTDALANPTFTSFNLTVPSYGPPGDPPQKGTGARVETFDARFWNVAYRRGSLWATHHVNAARTVARWYEIRMNGWPKSGQDPVLVQSGNIDPGASVWTTFSAITVNEDGAAAMVFARSAADEPYTMATAFRLPCDAPGTFRAPVSQQVTTGPYSQGRWGDYGSIEPDPIEPGKFWAIHEYAINDSWRCWIAPVTARACPPDLTCDGVLDLFDFLQFQNLFNAHDARADCDGNGLLDLFDFLCYVNQFNAGC